MDESVGKTPRSSSMIQPSLLMRSAPRKRLMIATIEKGKGAKAFNLKKTSYGIMKTRQFPVIPPFPYGAKKLSHYSRNG